MQGAFFQLSVPSCKNLFLLTEDHMPRAFFPILKTLVRIILYYLLFSLNRDFSAGVFGSAIVPVTHVRVEAGAKLIRPVEICVNFVAIRSVLGWA